MAEATRDEMHYAIQREIYAGTGADFKQAGRVADAILALDGVGGSITPADQDWPLAIQAVFGIEVETPDAFAQWSRRVNLEWAAADQEDTHE